MESTADFRSLHCHMETPKARDLNWVCFFFCRIPRRHSVTHHIILIIVVLNSIQKVFRFLCSVLCRGPEMQIRQPIFPADIHKALRKEGCRTQFI